jgi:hypothetical protein
MKVSPRLLLNMVRQHLPATDHLHLHKVQLSAPRLLVETHRLAENMGYGPTALRAE